MFVSVSYIKGNHLKQTYQVGHSAVSLCHINTTVIERYWVYWVLHLSIRKVPQGLKTLYKLRGFNMMYSLVGMVGDNQIKKFED